MLAALRAHQQTREENVLILIAEILFRAVSNDPVARQGAAGSAIDIELLGWDDHYTTAESLGAITRAWRPDFS